MSNEFLGPCQKLMQQYYICHKINIFTQSKKIIPIRKNEEHIMNDIMSILLMLVK